MTLPAQSHREAPGLSIERRQFVLDVLAHLSAAFVLLTLRGADVGAQAPTTVTTDNSADAEADRRQVEEIRDFAVRTLGPSYYAKYVSERDEKARMIMFGSVYALAMAPILTPLDAPVPSSTQLNVWKQLLVGLARLIPGAGVHATVAEAFVLNTGGGGNWRSFSVEAYDRMAQRAAKASTETIAAYLSPEAARTYETDPVLVKVRNLVGAVSHLLQQRGWPTVGLIFFSELPKVAGVSFGTPGSRARDEIVKPALGITEMSAAEISEWDRAWDAETNPRSRGLMVIKAFAAILSHAAAVLAEPQAMSVEDFMKRCSLKGWQWRQDVEPSHLVCEAFGKQSYERFVKLEADARTSSGLTPESKIEMDDLHRASVVQVITWKLAVALAI